jgi:hypothetical protein
MARGSPRLSAPELAPHDAHPKPDGIFGKHSAQEALAPIESPSTASQVTLTCTFIPSSSSGLPP